MYGVVIIGCRDRELIGLVSNYRFTSIEEALSIKRALEQATRLKVEIRNV